MGDVAGSVPSLRRAVELLPPDQADHWEAVVRLCEVYLLAGAGEKQYMDDVEKFTKELLKRDANSFDAHRLIGDLNYSKATIAYKNKHPEEGAVYLTLATAEYFKADSVKPGQPLVSM